MSKVSKSGRLTDFKAPETVDDIGSANVRSGVRQRTSSMFKMGKSPTSSPYTTPVKHRMPRSEFLSAADRQRSLPDLSPKVISVRDVAEAESEISSTKFPELRTPRRSTSLELHTPEMPPESEVSCNPNLEDKAAQHRITVCVRVRPLSAKEASESAANIRSDGNRTISVSATQHGTATPMSQIQSRHSMQKEQQFTVDRVFLNTANVNEKPTVTSTVDRQKHQAEIFDFIGRDALRTLLEGYNCTILAYGMTSSGKTYTMTGTREEPGLIPRFCEALFEEARNFRGRESIDSAAVDCESECGSSASAIASASASASVRNDTFQVELSYFEVLHERIYDLLAESPAAGAPQARLRVREHAETGPYVEGLCSFAVRSFADVDRYLAIGSRRRATAFTEMNEASSRSHSILTLRVVQLRDGEANGDTQSANVKHVYRVSSKVHFIDLAGSERASRIGNDADRLRESGSINKGLLALSKVITQLAEPPPPISATRRRTSTTSRGAATPTTFSSNFVSYRDSVLTWLLKESLGGNARTWMVATVSPANAYVDETISTLRYATQARRIVNAARVNRDEPFVDTTLMKELQRRVNRTEVENERLRDLLRRRDDELDEYRRTWRSREDATARCLDKMDGRMSVCLTDGESSSSGFSSLASSSTAPFSRSSAYGMPTSPLLSTSSVTAEEQHPKLVLLHNDEQFNEMLVYKLKQGETTVGSDRDSAKPKSTAAAVADSKKRDIVIRGKMINDPHCIFRFVNKTVRIEPIDNALVVVNGQRLKNGQEQVLFHNDRVALGLNHFFRLDYCLAPPPTANSDANANLLDFRVNRDVTSCKSVDFHAAWREFRAALRRSGSLQSLVASVDSGFLAAATRDSNRFSVARRRSKRSSTALASSRHFLNETFPPSRTDDADSFSETESESPARSSSLKRRTRKRRDEVKRTSDTNVCSTNTTFKTIAILKVSRKSEVSGRAVSRASQTDEVEDLVCSSQRNEILELKREIARLNETNRRQLLEIDRLKLVSDCGSSTTHVTSLKATLDGDLDVGLKRLHRSLLDELETLKIGAVTRDGNDNLAAVPSSILTDLGGFYKSELARFNVDINLLLSRPATTPPADPRLIESFKLGVEFISRMDSGSSFSSDVKQVLQFDRFWSCLMNTNYSLMARNSLVDSAVRSRLLKKYSKLFQLLLSAVFSADLADQSPSVDAAFQSAFVLAALCFGVEKRKEQCDCEFAAIADASKHKELGKKLSKHAAKLLQSLKRSVMRGDAEEAVDWRLIETASRDCLHLLETIAANVASQSQSDGVSCRCLLICSLTNAGVQITSLFSQLRVLSAKSSEDCSNLRRLFDSWCRLSASFDLSSFEELRKAFAAVRRTFGSSLATITTQAHIFESCSKVGFTGSVPAAASRMIDEDDMSSVRFSSASELTLTNELDTESELDFSNRRSSHFTIDRESESMKRISGFTRSDVDDRRSSSVNFTMRSSVGKCSFGSTTTWLSEEDDPSTKSSTNWN